MEQMKLLHKLKYRFSESYRIKIGCGLSPIRSDREYEAVIEFCKEQLKDKKHMKLNPDRKRIYETTVKLDKNWKKGVGDIIKFTEPTPERLYNDPFDFIEDHAGWYWS